MVCGKREAARTALLEATGVNNIEEKKSRRTDWNRFIKTGEMRSKPQADPHPMLQEYLDKITAAGGKLII